MEFKKIAVYDNYMLANMTLGLLQENNINCHLNDEHTVTIDPLLSNAIGGSKLMVGKLKNQIAYGQTSTYSKNTVAAPAKNCSTNYRRFIKY